MEQAVFTVFPGDPFVPGVTKTDKGIQFTIAVPYGEAELLLYREGEEEPFQTVSLPENERTGTVSSVTVALPEDETFAYAYRIGGKITTDPCTEEYLPHEAGSLKTGRGRIPVTVSASTKPLSVRLEDILVYKLHVRGFTMNKPRGIRHPGTFAGIAESIPYFQMLGINTILLMPPYEFDPGRQPDRKNYWGYTDGLYFAPRAFYSASGHPNREFADMVDALHKAGIACMAEFWFAPDKDPRFVTDVLRHWRTRFGLDGFRLVGEGCWYPSLMRDPLLKTTILFASHSEEEVQDQRLSPRRRVGIYDTSFRDLMRSFLKGDTNVSVDSAAWMLRRNGAAESSVSFFADQDGFTMLDMVSYEEKHNEENGESNRDGCDRNHSWNCGVEGPTRKNSVRNTRLQQLRNAVIFLMTAQGIPLLYAGDEMLNSQQGNNNAWCQDNAVGWTDWNRTKSAESFRDFVASAIRFRKEHPILHRSEPLRMIDYKACGLPDLSYHGSTAWLAESGSLKAAFGVLYSGAYAQKKDGSEDDTMYILYNMYWQEQEFALPEPPAGKQWTVKADTSLTGGFYDDGKEPPIQSDSETKTVTVSPRSICILTAGKKKK